MSIPSDPCFHEEAAAFAALESARWPDGPICAHCGATGRVYALKGKTTRLGLKKCGACRKQFTVKVGTPFESSHIALHKQLQALYLFAQSNNGVSAHDLHGLLKVTYKSAWVLTKRLREARRQGCLPKINPADDEARAGRAFQRVCELYSGQFRLTSHTRRTQNGGRWNTNNLSVGYALSGRTPTTTGPAKKSGPEFEIGWVRERRVLAAEAAALDIEPEDRARAHVYALLGAALARPPSAALLERFASLQGDQSPLGGAFAALAAAARDTAPSAAEEEYNALFIGMTKGEVTPYASYYLTGFLHEKPLARLRGDMARLGIAAAEDVAEPEDHISAICEMMAGLIEGRFGAPATLDAQRQFFERHLAPWGARFFGDLAAAASARLYMPIGAIGKHFVEIEAEAFAMA